MPSEATQFEPDNKAARTHGMHSVEARGAEALAPAIRYREHEIIKNLGTGDGALAELERVGLYYMLIVEQGAHYLRQLAESNENPWTAADGKPIAMLARFGTYLAGAQRTLGKLAELRGDQNVIELDSAMTAAREAIDGEHPESD